MTIIAALHDPERGETWIGSDTIAVRYGIQRDCGPKWTLSHGWALGVSGDWRTINIVRERHEEIFAKQQGAFGVAERLRSVLGEFDYDLKPAEGKAPPNCAQDFLLANLCGVWTITGNFAVLSVLPFGAEGSGSPFALGAMNALYNDGQNNPAVIVRAAVTAGMQYDEGCGGDVWIHKLGQGTA